MAKDLVFDADFDAMFSEDLPQLQPSPYTSSEYTVSELASEFGVSERQVRTLIGLVKDAWHWLDSEQFVINGKYTEFAKLQMIDARNFPGTYEDWKISIQEKCPDHDVPEILETRPITQVVGDSIEIAYQNRLRLRDENLAIETAIMAEIDGYATELNKLQSFLSENLRLAAERQAMVEFREFERIKAEKFAQLQRKKSGF